MFSIFLSTMDDPNDREFIHNLYMDNEKLLFAVALKIVPGLHEAEDVVQESLVKLIGKVATLQRLERCTLVAYVVSTVRNTAFNYMKKMNRQWANTEEFDEALMGDKMQPNLSFDELMIIAENRQKLVMAWADVPESDRTLLEGRYLLEMSDAELAQIFHCKPSSIRMKMSRARKNAFNVIAKKGVELI